MCIKPGQNLSFYGKFGDVRNGYNGIRIYLNKCKNLTGSGNCYSKEITERILDKASISFSYYGAVINNNQEKMIHYEINTFIYECFKAKDQKDFI